MLLLIVLLVVVTLCCRFGASDDHVYAAVDFLIAVGIVDTAGF